MIRCGVLLIAFVCAVAVVLIICFSVLFVCVRYFVPLCGFSIVYFCLVVDYFMWVGLAFVCFTYGFGCLGFDLLWVSCFVFYFFASGLGGTYMLVGVLWMPSLIVASVICETLILDCVVGVLTCFLLCLLALFVYFYLI